MTRQKRILIADDDPTVLLILRAILERMGTGYEVLAARNGTEALAILENTPCDLVITDVRMPGVDGIELAEAIRAQNANTALIWITAYGCHKLRGERSRLRVHGCLDKPLRIDQIRQAALEALEIDPGQQRPGE